MAVVCWPRAVWSAVALAVLGCTQPASQIVVVVDSDIAGLREVRATAADVADRERIANHVFTIGASPAEALVTLPFSFGVAPPGGDPERRVEIIVEGFVSASGEQPVVTRRIRTGFIRGRTLLLPVFLAEVCRNVPCPEEQTCIDGACETIDLPPESLESVTPGRELDDAGRPRDGAPAGDAGGPGDAALRDGGGASCSPGDQVGPMMVGSISGSLASAALTARPSGWTLAVSEDGGELVVFVLGSRGSLERRYAFATGEAWRMTAFPPWRAGDDAVLAVWGGDFRAGLTRLFLPAGTRERVTSTQRLLGAQVGGVFGTEPVVAVDTVPFGPGFALYSIRSLGRVAMGDMMFAPANGELGSRADGAVIFAYDPGSGGMCAVRSVEPGGVLSPPLMLEACEVRGVTGRADGGVAVALRTGTDVRLYMLPSPLPATPPPPVILTGSSSSGTAVVLGLTPTRDGGVRVTWDEPGEIRSVVVGPDGSQGTPVTFPGAVEGATLRAASADGWTALTWRQSMSMYFAAFCD